MKKSKIIILPLLAMSLCSCNISKIMDSLFDDCGHLEGIKAKILLGDYQKEEAVFIKGTKSMSLRIEADWDPNAKTKVNSFTISSSEPLTLFIDENENGLIDYNERSTTHELTSSPTTIDWVSELSLYGSSKKEAGPCWYSSGSSSAWTIYSEEGLLDNTEITLHEVAHESFKTTAPLTAKIHAIDPSTEIVVTEQQVDKYCEAAFTVTGNEHYEITSIDGTRDFDKGTYFYTGLDGEITIHYTYSYGTDDCFQYYGSYKYTLDIVSHEHQVQDDTATKKGGAIVTSCSGCDAYKTYRLDTANAVTPFEPSVSEQEDRIGVKYFNVDWDVSGIAPGNYDVYVKGSIYENQKDLDWKIHVPDSNATLCAYVLKKGTAETTPCSDLSYGESFGEGTGFRWTSTKIFNIDIVDGDRELSLWSTNYNGNLNDYVIHISSLLLVPSIK